MFEIKFLSDIPDVATLWQKVSEVQARARTRTLEEEAVKSGEFLLLCEAALRLCEKYKLDKGDIEVYEDGGAVNNSYKDKAETSALIFDGKIIKVVRTYARHVAFGDCGIRRCRICVPASNPVRKQLKADGWIDGGDRYARITGKTLKLIIPQPQPTDVVLGDKILSPQPTDAVLGGVR